MKIKFTIKPLFFSFFISVLLFSSGCNTAYLKNRFITDETKPDKKEIIVEQDDFSVVSDTEAIENVQEDAVVSNSYVKEQEILEELYDNYDEALIAHMNGNFGLAETKIENALLLFQQINLNDIEDESIVIQFKDAAIMVAQELGKILNESAIIAEEDPMAWLEDVDAEQFKSGQWTDEELEKIVLKIAVTADVPIEYNEQVRNLISYFQTRGRDDMAKWLKRSGRYVPLLREILAEEGIPEDMVYLSMIESGFSPRAYSRARAVGLWQFMYATGKIYGLNRNQWVDERRDPVKSTRAAARHMNDLYKSTDDWNIVMAMYNSGPTRIKRQIQQTENIEFWDLSLPRETRNYVPSFMAAVIIAKAPELFGFDNIEKDPPFEFDSVEVAPYTSLLTAAKCAGVDVAEIKELNPELILDRIPVGVESYELRIPKGCSNSFLVEYAKVPVEKYTVPQVEWVRVQRGDTFSGIADRYRISMSRLRAANPQITNINRLRVGQRINLVATAARSAIPRTVNVSRDDVVIYTVRKNDTLGILADRNNTTVRTLQALNNMGSSTRIYVDQQLLIPKNSSNSQSASAGRTVESVGTGKITYVIKKNDTIWEIAQRYGVNYQKLMEINKIKDHRKIQPGQTLIIER
ncbi:LysM peptidoglycan-binding domain-containing protein [Candidatus Latescibacterota bacterium]